ncbi:MULTISPECIES: DUF418 domain-containing protein [unclassified Sphingomonas]|uniref:DUF418 domain-containing protein n=1 Tax=unclassified Sphingomonas TaxID=196159 RepID=UPI0006FA5CD6|nr:MULTISPECIES: DUF418 domain-containing protein [unclassified Sphingomonas]KQS48995.1 hypothetical protein ASG20_07900 [Sphingomonas sp. Leaf198]
MTPAPIRIATLDLIRGVAVMGILASNIAAFGFPEFAYMTPASMGAPSTPDLIAWTTTFIVIDGKMRGLFSFLFGASMLLVIDRAEASGEDPATVHLRRMAWLFVFGIAHLYLLWWGDILAHYAMVGALAYMFAGLPVRWMIGVGLACIAFQTVELTTLVAYTFDLHGAAHRPGATARVITNWQLLADQFGQPSPASVTRELAIGRGGWRHLVAWRWTHAAGPITSLTATGPETLGFMLFGMAGLRSGFLTGEWSRRRYTVIAVVGIGLGWICYAAIAAFDIAHGFDARYVALSWLALATPLRPLTIMGYAAAIILLARPGGWLTTRVAAAGRMAFSNYLGTTVLCTTLFYGYGFGLYGALSRAQLYLVVVPICLLMLLWSKPWLDRFRYGPLEWLWRSLSRFAWQPMRGSAFTTNRSD